MPCRLFDPAWRLPAKHPEPTPSTPFELLHGMFEVMREMGLKEAQAAKLKEDFNPGSMEFKHADGWRVKFGIERRHFDAQRKKWRSYIDAHPELARLPITTPCRHQQGKTLPSCWDGESGLYTREIGQDDGDLDLPLGAVRAAG